MKARGATAQGGMRRTRFSGGVQMEFPLSIYKESANLSICVHDDGIYEE